MTLLISIFAAVFSTVKWYQKAPNDTLKLSFLCFMFWGASLMWFIDAIAEYIDLGAAYFHPEPAVMLNDAFLGLCVIALALVIWTIFLLIKDPRGIMNEVLFKSRSSDEKDQNSSKS